MSDKTNIQNDDTLISPEVMLGTFDRSGVVVDRYELLRRSAAGNVTALLSAQDEQYIQRQSELNKTFIDNVSRDLPKATLSAKVNSRNVSGFSLTSTYTRGSIKGISLGFEIPTNSHVPTEETLADVNGLRATVIWLDRDPDKILEQTDSRDVATRTSGKDVAIPYVIIGHNSGRERGDNTQLLLMPLIQEDRDRWSGGGRKAGSFTIRNHAEPIFSGSTVLEWKIGSILKAEMTTDQYISLIAMQDALMGNGIQQEELEEFYDVETKSFSINSRDTKIIRAEHGAKSLLRAKKAPQSKASLNSEEFDIHILEEMNGTIHPDDFIDFHVLEDVQRTTAMLGKTKTFEKAQKKLEEDTKNDPTVQLIFERVNKRS